jgi:hypothetical protein
MFAGELAMPRMKPTLKSQLFLVIVCLVASGCDGDDDDSDAGHMDAAIGLVGPDGGGQDQGSGGTGFTGSGGAVGAVVGTGGFGAGGTGFTGGAGGFIGTPLCSPCMCDGCLNCINCGMGCFCQDTPTGNPPQPVPWDPPFPSLGEPGYMDSDVPLCSGIDQVIAFGVYSDKRGVYAMVSGSGISHVGVTHEDDAGVDIGDMGPQVLEQYLTRTQIWQNDGEAWVLRTDEPDLGSTLELTGVPGGALFINDPTNFEILGPMGIGSIKKCALGVVQEGELTCQDVDPVQDVTVVDKTLAYAIMGGTRLLEFDGKTWHGNTDLLPYPATAVWGDHDDVIAVGKAGTVLWHSQNMWTLEDPGTLESFTSVWGTSRTDVYAGTSSGAILHYDGMNWKQIGKLGGTSCKTQLPVTGIWGADGVVFFHTDAQFARWNGTKLESLGNWTCGTSLNGPLRITSIAGNSSTEVFLSIIDPSRSFSGQDMCGGQFVVRFDGKKFHRM